MTSFKDLFKKVKNNKKVLRQIYVVSLFASLLLVVFFLKNGAGDEVYIVDKEGQLIGIERSSLEDYETYYLNLSIESDGGVSTREITINKSPVKSKDDDTKDDEEITEAEREAEITGILTDIELSDKKKVVFPSKLSDGSKLKWSIRKQDDKSYMLIPFIWLLLVLLIAKSAVDESNKDNEIARRDIMRSLPRFTNQLLLMMNAGMILSDSISRISESYKLIPEEQRSVFEKEIISLDSNNSDHRSSSAVLISELAKKYNTKELMRIATILNENEKRGSIIVEQLSRESSFFWENRKLIAREKGKMIDTRMAFPLGILLILLIIITMAPTLLSI